MTVQQDLRFAAGAFGGSDAVRAAELRRVKFLATGVLVGCLVLMVIGKLLTPYHAAFGFLAAFAEAATIGGLADWYAVVALFRRPLGLPIPHTAIIQKNQSRIADKLGEFVEKHFLAAGPVDAKLRQIDFASFIADWLSDAKRSGDLARFALRLLPEVVAASETSGLATFLSRRALMMVQSVDLAPLVAGALRRFIAQGRHQEILDQLMRAAHDALTKPETQAMFRQKIRDELPTLLRLYRADAFVMKKVAASLFAFFEDVRTHPDHPFRGEFSNMLLSLIDRLESDPGFRKKINSLRHDLLARPELSALLERAWASVKDFVDRSASGESMVLHQHLANVLAAAGSQLTTDPEMRAEINHGLAVMLRSFVAEQKSGVSTFIADQVKAWDMGQLINLIELNIGRDLQYIRFNGTIIGGLAGLMLYSVEVAIRTLG